MVLLTNERRTIITGFTYKGVNFNGVRVTVIMWLECADCILVQITAVVYLFFRTRFFGMGKRAASSPAGSRNKRARTSRKSVNDKLEMLSKKTPKKRGVRTRSITGGNANRKDSRQLHAVDNAEKKNGSSRKVDTQKKTSARRVFSADIRRAHHRTVTSSGSGSDEQSDRYTQSAAQSGSVPRSHVPTDETVSVGNANNRPYHAVGNRKKKTVNVRRKIPVTPARHSSATSGDSSSDEQSEGETQNITGMGSVPLLRIPTYETESEAEDLDPLIQQNHQNHENDNADVLSKATRAHVNVIAGGQPKQNVIQSPIFAEPISVPISTQIPSKIKRKIWANKYVDFSSLLPNYSSQPKQQKFTLQLGNDSTFNLVPQSYNRKITNVAQWTSAFLRFVAVYSEKFPQDSAQLMKYGEVIRDLAYRRPNLFWYNYDMQFRQLRETVAYRWDMIHYELWVPSATYYPFQGFNRARQQSYTNDTRRNNNPFLKNCCWAFNKSGCTRQGCNFPHTCGFCRGSHPAKQCTQQQNRPGPDIQGPQGGSGPAAGGRITQYGCACPRFPRR